MHVIRTYGGAFVIVGLVAALTSGCGASAKGTAGEAARTPSAAGPKAAPVSAARLARLPHATTYGTVHGAPADPAPNAPLDGTVVHPARDTPVYDRPGGKPIAVLPAKQLDGPTWVPVIADQGGWRRVLLPSRPDHTSGWLPTDKTQHTATSAYRIAVDRGAHRLTLTEAGRRLGAWTVAVGTAKNPTPAGRTFLLASLSPPKPTYSKLILPLGTHSNSLDSFGGGPGTVALHGWPDKSVFGHDVSHGCVRTPPAALGTLSRVPLGSPVQIT
ncbi:MAG TPA: L,D-transpeptidase [Streptosporangiaceae bacterium]